MENILITKILLLIQNVKCGAIFFRDRANDVFIMEMKTQTEERGEGDRRRNITKKERIKNEKKMGR